MTAYLPEFSNTIWSLEEKRSKKTKLLLYKVDIKFTGVFKKNKFLKLANNVYLATVIITEENHREDAVV